MHTVCPWAACRRHIYRGLVRRYAKLRPRFATTREAPFVSRVLLPNNSAVTAATGLPYPQKETARASACLIACRMLHKVPLYRLSCLWTPHAVMALVALMHA